MKKSLYKLALVVMILMAAGSVSYAQKMHHVGVKAGINFSSAKNGDYKDNLGYQAGITYQARLPLWFSVQPELLFHVKGANFDIHDMEQTLGLGYIELPVNLQWGPYLFGEKVRPFIQGTPYIGYAVSKQLDIATDSSKPTQKECYGWDNVNRFSYGAGVGAGIQLWAVQISAMYTWNFGSIASANAVKDIKDNFDKTNFSGYTLSLAIIF